MSGNRGSGTNRGSQSRGRNNHFVGNQRRDSGDGYRDQRQSCYQNSQRGEGDGGRPFVRRDDRERHENHNRFTNVRDICEMPENLSANVRQFRKGSAGTGFEVIANEYPILLGLMIVFRYEIEITEQRTVPNGAVANGTERKMRRLAQKENKQLVEQLAREWTEVFGGKVYVFDGQRCIFTGEKLRIEANTTLSRTLTINFDGFREQTYVVSIKFIKSVNLNKFADYYAGRERNTKHPDFMEVLQILEIILRYNVSKTRIPVGKCLYSMKNMRSIGDKRDNAEMALGHYQTVSISEVGPTLVVDRMATPFRKFGTLFNFIGNITNGLQNRSIHDKFIFKINQQLNNLKIFTTHIKSAKRFDTLNKLSDMKPSEYTFERDRKDGAGKETISVLDYFNQEYGITLKYPELPLVVLNGGNNRCLPIEVCFVCPEQPVPKSLITPNMTRNLVEFSNKQKPIQRFGFIHESLKTIINESRDLLEAFKIQIIEKPILLNARKINMPRVLGNDRRVYESIQLKDWCFINISPEIKGLSIAKSFVDEMIDIGRQMNINITPIGPSHFLNGVCNDFETVEKVFKKALTKCPKPQLFVFCISSESNPDDRNFNDDKEDDQSDGSNYGHKDVIYNCIKYFGDTQFGVITQCVTDKCVLQTPNGYFRNLLLKINSKIGGKNAIISPQSKLPIMKKKVMMVGVDVTHPGSNPGTERMISSVAAVVGSYDEDFIRYRAVVKVQRNKLEIVDRFDEKITELLNNYRKHNRCFPESIVVFRDGVSEGQFNIVMEHEYEPLLEACGRMNIKPKVTVIVVAKRHQTRLLPKVEEIDERSKKAMPNIPPGLVVDHTITNPMNYEMFLCSHKGMLGTSRPTKYIVLMDQNNMTADEIQSLCFYNCFICNRSTKSISVPSTVYNAHLAAFRAKTHLQCLPGIQPLRNIRNEPPIQREERETRFAEELNERIVVNESVKNLLYYC